MCQLYPCLCTFSKIPQRIKGSEVGFRSLDPKRQSSKPLLSCAKSSAASQGYFRRALQGVVLSRTSPSKWFWLSVCSQVHAGLCMKHSSRLLQHVVVGVGCSTGSMVMQGLPWGELPTFPPSEEPAWSRCSGTPGKGAWVGGREGPWLCTTTCRGIRRLQDKKKGESGQDHGQAGRLLCGWQWKSLFQSVLHVSQ